MSNFFLHANQEQQTEGEYGGRWNQLLCYPWVSCDVNSLHHVTSITPNKMADNEMSFRQCAVIESLLQKFTRDFSVLMEVCAWVQAVFEDGWNILKMGTRASKISLGSGRPQTASTECNKERVDETIQDDRRVTVDAIARTLGIGHNAVQDIIASLGHRKVCARWVPRLLTEDHKGQRKAITSELLQRYRHQGDDLFAPYCDKWRKPETKRQSMEWHHLHSP